MKGFSDQIIADKLTMEGHRILAKTVTGRWRRIRAAMEKDEEERMDDELSDWHVGEVSLSTSCTCAFLEIYADRSIGQPSRSSLQRCGSEVQEGSGQAGGAKVEGCWQLSRSNSGQEEIYCQSVQRPL